MKAIAVGLVMPLSLVVGFATAAATGRAQEPRSGIIFVGDINFKDVGGPEDQEDAPVIRSLRPPRHAPSTQTTQQPGSTAVPNNQSNPPTVPMGGVKPGAPDRQAEGQH